MNCWSKFLVLIFFFFLSVVPLSAVEIAIPSDMYTYQWAGNPDAVNPGYIYTAIWTEDFSNGTHRGYALAFDESGAIKFYHRNPHNQQLALWAPQEYERRHIYSLGHIVWSDGAIILDSTLVPIDTLQFFSNNARLDLHEIFYDENGNLWTLWQESQTVDLSQYIDGGHPNCSVACELVRQYDPNGNLVWEWRGFDHIDELPYTATDDTTDLFEDFYNHLHTNSISIAPNGDVLLSFRNLSIMAMIDYPSGDAIWRLGGGSANDFTFTGNADGHPLDFNRQHDARIWPDGTISVFDNGGLHPTAQSYAREYALDLDNMTAELTWCYTSPVPQFGKITGSFRRNANGHRLIEWGAVDPIVDITELDENEDVVWQISVDDDSVMNDRQIRIYRAYKAPPFPPAQKPYVSYVVDYDVDEVELVCNWWGHHDEVFAYEVWWGADGAEELLGTTDTGYYYIFDYVPTQIYKAKIRALDINGNVISGFSREIEVNTNPLNVEEGFVSASLPSKLTLAPVYPNPFNSRTNVNVFLPQPSSVKLEVCDVLGRRVVALYSGRLNAGQHPFTFDAGNLGSGVYFIRASTPAGINMVRRAVILK